MTLDEFKAVAPHLLFEKKRRSDIIDYDNGTALIYAENLNKYLERYACKDEDDLQNTLWYSYGMSVKIVD